MHKIYHWPEAPPHTHAGELPTLQVGWDRHLGQGGAAGPTFAPGATDPGAATASTCEFCGLIGLD